MPVTTTVMILFWAAIGGIGAYITIGTYANRASVVPWTVVAAIALALALVLRRSRYVVRTALLFAVVASTLATVAATSAPFLSGRGWFAAMVLTVITSWFAAWFALAWCTINRDVSRAVLPIALVVFASLGPTLLGVQTWQRAIPPRVAVELQLIRLRHEDLPNFTLFQMPREVTGTWNIEPVDYGLMFKDRRGPSYLQAFPTSSDGGELDRVWFAFRIGRLGGPAILGVRQTNVFGAYPGYEVTWQSDYTIGRTHIAAVPHGGMFEVTAYTPKSGSVVERVEAADQALDRVVLGPWVRGQL